VPSSSPSEFVLKSGPHNRDDTTVARFAEKIARLEEEVKHGQVDVADGGVWLNGLQSLSKNVTDLPKPIPGYEDRIRVLLKADGERSDDVGEAVDAADLNVSTSTSGVGLDNEIHTMFSLSDVLQDSKRSVATVVTSASTSSSSPESSQTQEAEGSPNYMLKTHRGFQMKRLENIILDIQKKVSF
jgi:hypothetical protein